MTPGAPLARRVEEGTHSGDLESIHAGADHGQADDGDGGSCRRTSSPASTAQSGDVAAAFAASDATVSATFRTPWVYQAYIEPQVATAWLEPGGTLVVSVATQGSFVSRSELARAYGLPLERIRVIAEPLGGAFGGKFALVEPLAAGATLALRRPVRLVMTRQEDFAAHEPRLRAGDRARDRRAGGRHADGHPRPHDRRPRLERRLGRRGDHVAARRRPVPLGGARRHAATACRRTASRSAPTAARARRRLRSPSSRCSTSSPPSSASTRSSCGSKNALVEGDQGVTGPVPTFGAVEVIEAAQAHALWAKRDSLPEDEGIGVAAGYWPGGNEPAAAVCRVDTDGTMTVVTSAVDMTGVDTGFATIAAAAFGLPPEKVRVVMADTATGPVRRRRAAARR